MTKDLGYLLFACPSWGWLSSRRGNIFACKLPVSHRTFSQIFSGKSVSMLDPPKHLRAKPLPEQQDYLLKRSVDSKLFSLVVLESLASTSRGWPVHAMS